MRVSEKARASLPLRKTRIRGQPNRKSSAEQGHPALRMMRMIPHSFGAKASYARVQAIRDRP